MINIRTLSGVLAARRPEDVVANAQTETHEPRPSRALSFLERFEKAMTAGIHPAVQTLRDED
jgi:hypothetical protein